MDRSGQVGPLEVPRRPYAALSLSPDGQRVVVEIDDGAQQQIWRHDVSRAGSLTRLRAPGINNQEPEFTPDRNRISFIAAEGRCCIDRVRRICPHHALIQFRIA